MSKRVGAYAAAALTFGLLASLTSAGEEGRQPLVVTKRTSFLDPSGVERLQHINTIAYRQDGSYAIFRRVRTESGPLGDVAEVVNVRDGSRTLIDYSTQSVSTTKLPEGAAARLALKPSCGELTSRKGAEIQEFQGFEAVREVFEKNGNRIERWVAPELDCVAMKEIQTEIEPNGQEGSSNIIEVLSVQLGEPLSQLFEVPSGFTERSPSEMVAERSLYEQRLAGVEEPTADYQAVPEEISRLADIRYHANKFEKKKEPPSQ